MVRTVWYIDDDDSCGIEHITKGKKKGVKFRRHLGHATHRTVLHYSRAHYDVRVPVTKIHSKKIGFVYRSFTVTIAVA